MTAKPGIIYLQKDKFQLFSPFLRQIVEFRFVPEMIRDSDVINNDLLESLVKVFVTNTKIPPGNLTIILADNAYFVKDYVLPAPPAPKPGQLTPPQPSITMETLSVMSMDFVEHVPYENVVSMNFPLKNGIRVCAVNKDFYEALKVAFEKLGFTVDAVYPGLVLGNNLSAKPVMDTIFVNAVFQKGSTIKQYDLLQQKVFSPDTKKSGDKDAVEEAEDAGSIESKDKKPNKKRLFAMIGLLAVLLIILAVVAVQNMAPVPPPQPAVTTQTAPPAVPPVDSAATVVTEVPVAAPELSPSKLETQDLSMQIVTSSAADTAAKSLREAFAKYTFKNLTTQTQPNTSTSSTLVTFSAATTQDVRTIILEEIRKIKTDVTVQEKEVGEFDITIILEITFVAMEQVEISPKQSKKRIPPSGLEISFILFLLFFLIVRLLPK